MPLPKHLSISVLLTLAIMLGTSGILLSYLPATATGEFSNTQTISSTLTAVLLPVVPALWAYPDARIIFFGMTAGVPLGITWALTHFPGAESIGAALADIAQSAGSTPFLFFTLLSILVAGAGVVAGWNINYSIIALAERWNKEWP